MLDRLAVRRRIIKISVKLLWNRCKNMKYFLENSCKSAVLISLQNLFYGVFDKE